MMSTIRNESKREDYAHFYSRNKIESKIKRITIYIRHYCPNLNSVSH